MNLRRRLKIVRLVLSFIKDSRKMTQINRRLTGNAREIATNQVWQEAGERFQQAASELAGLFVKIGQFLNMRQDLFPTSFTEQLTPLLDAVPITPFSQVRLRMEQEWQHPITDILSSIDETPIGSASLAQVYRAVLKDGSKVAIKVLRPGIERASEIDLNTLNLVAHVLQKFKRFRRWMNFVELHREFYETIQQELNESLERENMREFQTMFDTLNRERQTPVISAIQKYPRIIMPRVYEQWSTGKVLVMEYMEGVKVSNLEQLEAWGINSQQIAEVLVDAYLHQFLVEGLVHVDPHPGNLLIQADGNLCFLDFGMTGRVSKEEQTWIIKLLQAAVFGNVDGAADALTTLGFFPPQTDRSNKQAIVFQLLEGVSQLGGAHPEKSAPFSRISEPFRHGSPLRLQAKYMFLLRSLGLLSTTLVRLHPGANWSDVMLVHAFPVMMSVSNE